MKKLLILFAALLLVSCSNSSEEPVFIDEELPPFSGKVEKSIIEGHEFLIFYNCSRFQAMHSPACPCQEKRDSVN